MNKKIVFYTMAMTNGGSERVLSNLANYLSEKQYDIYLICNINAESYYELSDKIHYIILDKSKIKNKITRIIRKISLKRSFILKKKLDEIKPDLIVAFLPEPSLRCLQIKKYKTIISERCDPNIEYSNIILRTIMKKMFKKADGFVFQTHDVKEYYSNIINCESRIILNPLNEKFIGKKYVGKDAKTIVNVGRLSNQKNQTLLINAFAKFNKEYSDYVLKIYGEGPLENKLIECARQNGIENKVKFMGISNELYNEMIKDKMFILSSDYEGVPNALIEAMAVGMPCISTDCPVGGPKMLINNNENGILIDVNNKEQLFEAMKKIASDKEFADKLSQNAMESMKEYYPDIICNEWENFIAKFLKS